MQQSRSEILKKKLDRLCEPKDVHEYLTAKRTIDDLLSNMKESAESARKRAGMKRKIDDGLEYDYNDDSFLDTLKKTMDDLAAIYEPKYDAYVKEKTARKDAYEEAQMEERREREAKAKARV